MIKNCLQCDKEFKTHLSYIKRGYGKFCSLLCTYASLGWRQKIGKTCKKVGVGKWMKGRTMSSLNKQKLIEAATGVNNWRWKGGKPECKDCFKQLSSYGAKLCVRCKGLSFRGEKNPAWKGDIYPANRRDRDSDRYKNWAELVKEQDDYRCMDCGGRGGKLESDHIYRFAYYPRLRFEILNGQTLCVNCHKQKTIFERTGRMELNSPIPIT